MKDDDKKDTFKFFLFDELEKEQKEEVEKGNYDPWNFEEEDLEDDDYYYDDDKDEK